MPWPKQKKWAVMASKAPYSTSKKKNSGDPPDTAESQNSESLHCGVCTTGVDDIWYSVRDVTLDTVMLVPKFQNS